MKKYLMVNLPIVALLVLLTACSMVDDMQDMMQQQQQLNSKIKRDYGWDPQIGWNINNGTFTQITFSFDSKDVAKETVEGLQQKMTKLVEQTFEQKPQLIIIQIISDNTQP